MPNKNDNLISVLERLKQPESMGLAASVIDDFRVELETIYSDDFRHSYSLLSKFMELLAPDELDLLLQNITAVRDAAEALPEKSPAARSINKLYDHISLDIIRLNRLAEMKYIGEQAKKDHSATADSIKEQSEKLQGIEDTLNGFHSQSIVILGIFSAMVVGFTIESNVFVHCLEHLTALNLNNVLLFMCVAGIIVFDTLFLLLYCISKISGKSIAVSCRSKSCASCAFHHGVFKRLWYKYPYMLLFNGIALFVIVVTLLFCK